METRYQVRWDRHTISEYTVGALCGTLTSKITSGSHIDVLFNKWIDLTWTIEDRLCFVLFILV